MHQEIGHLNCTFKIARTLQRRAHKVRYFAAPRLESHIRGQGLETVPWFPEFHTSAEETELGALAHRREVTRRFAAMADQMLSGGSIHAEVAQADVVVVDVNEPLVAMLASRSGVPCMLFSTALPQTKDIGVPPPRMYRDYAHGSLAILRAELDWLTFRARRRIGCALADMVGACPPYELAARIAPRFGIQPARLDTWTAYMPQIRGLPELVSCCEDFDFPRPPSDTRHYVESVDLQRTEPPFPWEWIDPDKPLIYCSLGTNRYRSREVSGFFDKLLAAIAVRRRYQLVLSTGAHNWPETCPPNALIVPNSPQLAMLARASVMITHAGLGSVKECILHAVPMLAVPLAIDQPGNAARIEHHGLGLVASVARTTPTELTAMLDVLIREQSFRMHAQRMREKLEAVENAESGADLIERAAQGLARPASRPLERRHTLEQA